MTVTIPPFLPDGSVAAIASKSAAHRHLICAAFADTPTEIQCEETNQDIEATVRCLSALGAQIVREAPFYYVAPITTPTTKPALFCGESGSTLRFLLPVVAALGCGASFHMEGRLPNRPLSPLYEELTAHHVALSTPGSNPLVCSGSLRGNAFTISGAVSSQFISGMLFALTLRQESGQLTVKGKIESLPYIDMTVDSLSAFGRSPQKEGDTYVIDSDCRLYSPKTITVEGDWSNAAFPLAAGALSGCVSVCNLSPHSRQGDRAIVDLLQRFGAIVQKNQDTITVRHAPLRGITVDASDIPDLVPILATVASLAEGQTVITGASRLRFKESDRLCTTRDMLCALGADVQDTADGLIINGKSSLTGGHTHAYGDHRIAMSAAVAAIRSENPVILENAEACKKSYPGFWHDFEKIGACCSFS